MIVAGLVVAGLAAAVHGFIFWLESVAWRTARARRIFGISEQDAATTAPLALNQGFYNLFLGVTVVVGIVLASVGASTAGRTTALVGTGSMLAASVVLVASDRTKLRPALVQGVLPLAAILLLVIGSR